MFDYRDFSNRLHIRGVDFDIKTYLFVLMVCGGEDPAVAYGMTKDEQEFKRHVPSENEDEYFASIRHDAELMLETQECVQLREIIEEEIRSEIQSKATNIKEYKYTSQQIVNMLSSLLADRSQSLSEASVKDIVQLIRELGALGGFSGTDTFSNHFIQLPARYNIMCPNCNHEGSAVEGLDFRCEFCGAVAKWSENRFYPELPKL